MEVFQDEISDRSLEERVEGQAQTSVPQRNKFSEKMHEMYVAGVGNRVTAAGVLCITNFLKLLFSDEIASVPLWYSMSSFILHVAGCATVGYTEFGVSTLRFYRRTGDHIKKHGELNRHFARTIMQEESENSTFIGYCQQQGIYLAALHYGQVKSFREFQKKYSKIKIPFF